MSSGSQITTYVTPESTAGETPATPTWETLSLVGNTMSPNVGTTLSEQVRDNRMRSGSIITSLDYQGDLSGEMAAAAFDSLLSAAFYSDWDSDVLTIGTTRKTFTLVKAFGDIGVFSTFKGVHISAMNLNIPEEGKIDVSFTGMALGYEDSETDPTSTGTVTPSVDTAPMGSATSVGDVLVDGQTLAGEACISSLSLSLDNSMQIQRCLGKAGPGALIANTTSITGTMTMAWSKSSWEQWKKMLTREPIGISFPLQDSAGNSYTFNLPEVEIDGELPDGGAEEIVEVSLNYTARNTPVTITRVVA